MFGSNYVQNFKESNGEGTLRSLDDQYMVQHGNAATTYDGDLQIASKGPLEHQQDVSHSK